jgi:hypothetical protein
VDPRTRGEATPELLQAVDALGEVARRRGVLLDEAATVVLAAQSNRLAAERNHNGQPPLEIVGAVLLGAHRRQLVDALGATERFDAADHHHNPNVDRLDPGAAAVWRQRAEAQGRTFPRYLTPARPTP